MTEKDAAPEAQDAEQDGLGDFGDAFAEEEGPLVIDLGKCKRKAIKKLRKGCGPLMGDVCDTLDMIRECSTADKDVELVPVVFVCTPKRKKRSWLDYL